MIRASAGAILVRPGEANYYLLATLIDVLADMAQGPPDRTAAGFFTSEVWSVRRCATHNMEEFRDSNERLADV
jgi:hypothetical protein